MKKSIAAAIAALVLAFPASAFAHVEITPDEIAPGGAGLFTITAPVEGEQPMTGLRITIPEQLAIEGISPAPGFTGEVVRDQSGRATALSWQGGNIPSEQVGLFQFSGSVPDSVGDLRMVAVQTFADGSTKTWKDTAVIHVGDAAESGSSSSSDDVSRGLAADRAGAGRRRPGRGAARMEEATRLIRVTAVGLTLAAGAAFPAAAWAHATLLSTSPAVGAVVIKAPASVLIKFDQEVRPVAGGSQVIDSNGDPVTDGAAHTSQTDVKTLVIPLQADLPKGDYTVRWEIVATDGHLESGVFAFGVGTGRPPPQAASFSGSDQDWKYLLARTAYFAGLLVLIGGVVYRVLVFAPVLESEPAEARPMMSLRERHRANQVLAASAVLTLAGGWVALTIQGADVAGVSFWEAFDHRGPVASALDATRFGREFGRGIDVTAGFTVIVAVAYAAAPYGRRIALGLLGIPAAVLGIWALAVPGLSGHAGDPGGGLLALTLDAAHVAAAAVWAGGLVQLAWVTPHATRGLPEAQRSAARTAIARRFSTIALISVVVVALTGLGRALNEFSSVSEVWSTSYGQTLIVKSLLLAALVALGYRNRHMLTQFSSLRRSVTVELGLMTALVAAVALLTNLPPGKLTVGSAAAAGGQPAAPSGGPARIALEGGNALLIWPGTAGSNALALQLKGGAKNAEALLELPDGSTRTVTLEPDRARRILGLRRRSPGRHDQRDHRLRIGDARRQAADRQGLRRPRRRAGTRAGRRAGRRRGGRPGRRGAAHRRRPGAHHRAGAGRQRAPQRARPGRRPARSCPA